MNVTMLGNTYSPYSYMRGMGVDYVSAPGTSYLNEGPALPATSTLPPATTEEKVKASQIISFLVDTTKDVTGIVNDIKSGGGSKSDQNAYKLALEAMAKSGNNPALAQQAVNNAPMSGATVGLIGIGAVVLIAVIFLATKK